MNRKETLIKLAKDFDELMYEDSKVKLNVSEEQLERQIVKMAKLLEPDDKDEDVITGNNLKIVKGLLEKYPDMVKEFEDKHVKDLIELGLLPEETEEAEPEEPSVEEVKKAEEVSDDEIDLSGEIIDAERRKDLVTIAKNNDEFKDHRGELSKYQSAKELREFMLDVLDGKAKKKIESGKPVKVEKEKGRGKSPNNEKVEFFTPLIKEGKYTKEQLIQKGMKQFPHLTKSTIQTFLTDAKNPKYNKFENLIIQDSEDIISFKK